MTAPSHIVECGCPACVAGMVKTEMLKDRLAWYFATTAGGHISGFFEAFGEVDAITQLAELAPELRKGVFVAAAELTPEGMPEPELLGRLLTLPELKPWLEKFNVPLPAPPPSQGERR